MLLLVGRINGSAIGVHDYENHYDVTGGGWLVEGERGGGQKRKWGSLWTILRGRREGRKRGGIKPFDTVTPHSSRTEEDDDDGGRHARPYVQGSDPP